MKQYPLILFCFLSLVSLKVNAAFVYGNYSWDQRSNFVENVVTGQKWLRWIATDSMTEQQVKDSYINQGWMFATQTEVGSLFDDFFPISTPMNGYSSWRPEAGATSFGKGQEVELRTGISGSEEAFLAMFGVTWSGANAANAWVLDKTNGNSSLAQLQVGYLGSDIARIYWDLDSSGSFPNIANRGYALVQPAPVPLPATFWLFFSAVGLLSAFIRKRV